MLPFYDRANPDKVRHDQPKRVPHRNWPPGHKLVVDRGHRPVHVIRMTKIRLEIALQDPAATGLRESQPGTGMI